MSINVIYPLVIESQAVYEDWGRPSGLSVSVNLVAKRVEGVWGLMRHQYAASDYATATEEDIQKAIKQGGRQPQWYPTDGVAKSVEITLGTPTRAFVKVWQWQEKSSNNNELLVPALYFPCDEYPYRCRGVVQP